MRSRTWIAPLALATLLVAGAEAGAQEDLELEVTPAPPGETLEERVATLERELAILNAAVADDDDDDEDDDDDDGYLQFQLRGGWFHLAHNHRDELFKRSDSQYGWMAGVGLVIPAVTDLFGDDDDDDDDDDDGDDDFGVDLAGHIAIEYRNLRYSPDYRSPTTGEEGTASYVDIFGGPMLRFRLGDVVTPFIMTGMTMQIASPPEEEVSFLDLGYTLGLGVDFRLHEHVSFGVDYRWTWFGVADQEDEDYGQLAGYLAFNY